MKGTVLYNLPLGGDNFLLGVRSPRLAEASRAGQFVMLRTADSRDPLLRRPFSFYSLGESPVCGDREPGVRTIAPQGTGARTRARDSVEFLYRVVGQGTGLMARMNAGLEIDLLGPLGNSFPLPARPSRIFLVAGGIGVAPLLAFLEDLYRGASELFRSCRITLFFGARQASDIVGVEDFEALGVPVQIATEDGSRGRRGLVTDLLPDFAGGPRSELPPLVYTCGPHVMMGAVAARCRRRQTAGYASLERVMGCGFGACLGCVVKVPTAADSGLPFRYRFACTEGPVFPLEEVLW